MEAILDLESRQGPQGFDQQLAAWHHPGKHLSGQTRMCQQETRFIERAYRHSWLWNLLP